jgi:hypothetical protein
MDFGYEFLVGSALDLRIRIVAPTKPKIRNWEYLVRAPPNLKFRLLFQARFLTHFFQPPSGKIAFALCWLAATSGYWREIKKVVHWAL